MDYYTNIVFDGDVIVTNVRKCQAATMLAYDLLEKDLIRIRSNYDVDSDTTCIQAEISIQIHEDDRLED